MVYVNGIGKFMCCPCRMLTWGITLSDSTRYVCQGLMLYDTLVMGLRWTPPYGTQVARLRVDTTPDMPLRNSIIAKVNIDSENNADVILLWPELCWDPKHFEWQRNA